MNINGEFLSFGTQLRKIKFENDSVEHIILARVDRNESGDNIFYINDIQVTEAEFNSRMELFESIERATRYSLR